MEFLQVINFFSYKLEQKDQSQLGVTQVLTAIQQGTSEWPRDRLRVRIGSVYLYCIKLMFNQTIFN